MKNLMIAMLGLMLMGLAACGDSSVQTAPLRKLTLQLNWVPEPEFGGFYAAQGAGLFKERGLDVDIRAWSANSNVIQMIDRGAADLGTVSADELAIARSKGADLVAIFAVYQNCPQGLMVHEEKGYKTLAEVFGGAGGANPGAGDKTPSPQPSPGGRGGGTPSPRPSPSEGRGGKSGQGATLIAEPGLPYVQYLIAKFGGGQLRIVPYTYNIQPFLDGPDMVQQCFITSEPIQARRKGARVTVFPIGDSGFDPYTTVVIVRGDFLRKNREAVAAFVAAVRVGWRAYLDDPTAANAAMGQLNRNMDADTFAAAAAAQKPYIENAEAKKNGLGTMTAARWQTLIGQLTALGLIAADKAPQAGECFVDWTAETDKKP